MKNIKDQAITAWIVAQKSYEHMNRQSWSQLYPGWQTTVKSHFLMGWRAGRQNDIEVRNIMLDYKAKGDEYQMTTIPFIHGFGEGYLSSFDEDDVIDIEAKQSTETKFLQGD